MRTFIRRRTFIRSVAAMGLGLPAGLCGSLVRAASPNGMLNHACIGTEGIGWKDFNDISSHPKVNIVALCDIDSHRYKRAAAKRPNARTYQDWRQLVADAGDKIDSFNVSVPDHMHATMAYHILQAHKHLYCQKPLTHDIHETRAITKLAAKVGVTTQMGTQLSSTLFERTGVDIIRQGVIGKVKRVYLWSNRVTDTVRGNYRMTGPRPDGADPVPATIDWNNWLGTAPVRPYKSGIYHPTWWRSWQDFGTGWLGDLGCHIHDAPFRAIGLTAPISVQADVEKAWLENPARRKDNWPTSQTVEYVYPGTDMTVDDTLRVTWSDGGRYPDDALRANIDDRDYPSEGAMIIGEKGTWLMPHGSGPTVYPRHLFAEYKKPDLPPGNQYHDWVDAAMAGKKSISDFSHAGPLTEAVLLGTVALRAAGQLLQWDAPSMRITNVAEANQYLQRKYRDGWVVPELSA